MANDDTTNPSGDKSRGAAMGRTSIKEIPRCNDCPPDFDIHIERVFINDQGYDSNGMQFGVGMPLFWIYAEAEIETSASCSTLTTYNNELVYLDYVERFTDIEDAVRIVKQTWPSANVIASEAWFEECLEKYLDEEYERERNKKEAEECPADYLENCVTKPPSLDQSIWDNLIERVRLSQNVCERLMRISMTSSESGSIDTGTVCELFEDASKVTGIPLTRSEDDDDADVEEDDEPPEEDTDDEDSNNDEWERRYVR